MWIPNWVLIRKFEEKNRKKMIFQCKDDLVLSIIAWTPIPIWNYPSDNLQLMKPRFVLLTQFSSIIVGEVFF